MLIGVYGLEINSIKDVAPETAILLHLWMEVEVPKDHPAKLLLRAVIEQPEKEEEAFIIPLDLPPAPTAMQQASVQFPCRLDFAHSLRMELSEGNEKPQIIRRLKINPFSSAPPRPSRQ